MQGQSQEAIVTNAMLIRVQAVSDAERLTVYFLLHALDLAILVRMQVAQIGSELWLRLLLLVGEGDWTMIVNPLLCLFDILNSDCALL